MFLFKEMLAGVCKCAKLNGWRVATGRENTGRIYPRKNFLLTLGLLFLLAARGSGTCQCVSCLEMSSPTLCTKATIFVERFKGIRCFLRFDEKRTREFRLQRDHVSTFRYIWDLFISNCKKRYNLSKYVTINEKLMLYDNMLLENPLQ